MGVAHLVLVEPQRDLARVVGGDAPQQGRDVHPQLVHHRERLTALHLVPRPHVHRGEHAVDRRGHRVLHLHRLQHDERLSGR